MSQTLVKQGRRPSFLDTSLRLDGITELLQIINMEPRKFSDLCKVSKIKFKKSFMKYLRYCVDQGFMTKTRVSRSGAHERFHALMSKGRFYTFYHITAKGRLFLEITK